MQTKLVQCCINVLTVASQFFSSMKESRNALRAAELKLWYLSQVNLVQHHQAGAPVVVDQPPEVLDGVGQRMLGDDEGGGLPVALRESEEGDTSQKTLPPVERRSAVPHSLLTAFCGDHHYDLTQTYRE